MSEPLVQYYGGDLPGTAPAPVKARVDRPEPPAVILVDPATGAERKVPLIDPYAGNPEIKQVLHNGKWIKQVGEGPYCSVIVDPFGEMIKWCAKAPMSHRPEYSELIKPPEYVPYEGQSVEEKNKAFLELALKRGYWPLPSCENVRWRDPVSAAQTEVARVGAAAAIAQGIVSVAFSIVGPIGAPFKFLINYGIGQLASLIGERRAAQELKDALEEAQALAVGCTLWREEKDARTGERRHYGVDGVLAGFCYDPDRTLREKIHLGPGAYAELKIFAPCVTKWELVPVEGHRGVFIKKPVY